MPAVVLQSRDFLGKGMAFPVRFVKETGGTETSVVTASDHTKIRQCLRMLFSLRKGSMLFNRGIGGQLYKAVFEGNNSILQGLIRQYLREVLDQDPRVILLAVHIDPEQTDEDGGHFVPVVVRYRLINSQVPSNWVWPYYLEKAA